MTILPRRRGERYPVDFAALLAFSPSPYHPEYESIKELRKSLEVTETAEHFRRELFQLGEPVFDQLAAYFEDPRRSTDADFPTLAAHTAHSSAASRPPNNQLRFEVAELQARNGVLLLQASAAQEAPT